MKFDKSFKMSKRNRLSRSVVEELEEKVLTAITSFLIEYRLLVLTPRRKWAQLSRDERTLTGGKDQKKPKETGFSCFPCWKACQKLYFQWKLPRSKKKLTKVFHHSYGKSGLFLEILPVYKTSNQQKMLEQKSIFKKLSQKNTIRRRLTQKATFKNGSLQNIFFKSQLNVKTLVPRCITLYFQSFSKEENKLNYHDSVAKKTIKNCLTAAQSWYVFSCSLSLKMVFFSDNLGCYSRKQMTNDNTKIV